MKNKVICISSSDWRVHDSEHEKAPLFLEPEFGMILTIDDVSEYQGRTYYAFEEIPGMDEDGVRHYFEASLFLHLLPKFSECARRLAIKAYLNRN